MTNLLVTWNTSQPLIKERIGASSYDTWFVHLTADAVDETILTLSVPDEFFKTWIVDHYLNVIHTTIKEAGIQDFTIEFHIRPDAVVQPRVISQPDPELVPQYAKHTGMVLQKRFTFDNFVVGSSNRLANAASRAVADSPAKAYNPLFLYGQTGLGKTHLMQSIANHVSKESPHLNCLYLSSEQFTHELIRSIQTRSTAEFRQKFRTIDVLLIDDIQFIAGKESTQEEFFHTFNTLHDHHKQIIVSSDRPPKEISRLEERLVTRFTWAAIADIQPPDYETRVAILRKKSELESVKVPDDVLYFIAEQIKTNIRELEGALIRVVANSLLLEERGVCLELARDVLKDMVKESMKTISIEMIQQKACDYFHISMADLKSRKRAQQIALPRQIAMYLIRQFTQHSLPEIGNAFGGKDHTTVIHSCKKIEKSINTNSQIAYIVEKLSTELNE